jgi:hypothetical protein
MYFTKYLPVKGEIKHGDKVIYNLGEVVDYVVPLNTDNLKKCKLFLCSRDIQVGDAYYWGNAPKACEFHHLHCSGEEIMDGSEYKIIGEISPDALSYVEEGQEFEEDQVRMRYISKDVWGEGFEYYLSLSIFFKVKEEKNIRSISDRINHIGDPKGLFYTGVEVKGPCGHFH